MPKGKYVDGFVIVVPKAKRADYKKMAALGKKMWMKYGALDYKECVGDDMSPDTGGMKMKGFMKLANAKEDEEVWFSFITYTSKKHRNEVNKSVMAEMDKKMAGKDMRMPFDFKKFSMGGFKVEVGA
jgi:uncharacterized protein YbaA (DUF1428 family)